MNSRLEHDATPVQSAQPRGLVKPLISQSDRVLSTHSGPPNVFSFLKPVAVSAAARSTTRPFGAREKCPVSAFQN